MEKKLPIPLQSVTMSAEQYEILCDKVSQYESLNDRLEKFLNALKEANVHFRTENGTNPFQTEFNSVKVMTSSPNMGTAVGQSPMISIIVN